MDRLITNQIIIQDIIINKRSKKKKIGKIIKQFMVAQANK